MKGVVFQTSTATTVQSAKSGSAVQASLLASRPASTSHWLMTPNWSCSIQPHILAETMVGIAQGTSTAARTQARPLNSWFSSIATARPSAVSSVTDTSENFSVLRIDRPQSLFQKPSVWLGLANRPYSPK